MAVTNSLTKQDSNKLEGIASYLTKDAVKQQIFKIVGSENGTRLITSIVANVNSNKELQTCTNSSIMTAALLGESLKLSPSPQLGLYYMIPFNDKEKGRVATFVLSYKGYIQLAIRSGVYKSINVTAIKQGELIKFDPLTEEIEVRLIEDDMVREKTPTAGYFASFTYLNGFKKSIYWSKEKMIAHATRYSKSFKPETYNKIQNGEIPQSEMWKYNNSPWLTDFDNMAYKTMLRQLISKWGLISADMEKAYTADMSVVNENGTYTYVDNDDTVVEAPVTKEEPIMPPPVEDKPKGGAPETPEEAAAIAGALFK